MCLCSNWLLLLRCGLNRPREICSPIFNGMLFHSRACMQSIQGIDQFARNIQMRIPNNSAHSAIEQIFRAALHRLGCWTTVKKVKQFQRNGCEIVVHETLFQLDLKIRMAHNLKHMAMAMKMINFCWKKVSHSQAVQLNKDITIRIKYISINRYVEQCAHTNDALKKRETR